MNLVVALFVIGQVGAGGEFQPPASSQFGVPPAAVDETVPTMPAVQVPTGEPAADSAARLTVGDERPRPVGRRGIEMSASSPVPLPAGSSFRSSPAASTQEAAATSAPTASPSTFSPAAGTDVTPRNTPAGPSPELQAAADLIRDILALDERTAPTVRRTRLVEALARAGDSGSQAAAISAYWDLAQRVALARYAAGHVQFLLSVPEPSHEADRALFEAAMARAEADSEAAQDQLLASQYRVLRVGLMAWDGLMPWPVDLPLVTAYRTNFEVYYAQRPATLDVRHIHHSLPQKLRLIERRVAAVAAAETATEAMLESYKGGAAPLTLLLQTVERMEQARRDFVAAVMDYNGRIAEYSLATVGPSLAPETLVSTLIRTPAPSTSLATIPRDVRPAAAEAPALTDRGTFRR